MHTFKSAMANAELFPLQNSFYECSIAQLFEITLSWSWQASLVCAQKI